MTEKTAIQKQRALAKASVELFESLTPRVRRALKSKLRACARLNAEKFIKQHYKMFPRPKHALFEAYDRYYVEYEKEEKFPDEAGWIGAANTRAGKRRYAAGDSQKETWHLLADRVCGKNWMFWLPEYRAIVKSAVVGRKT